MRRDYFQELKNLIRQLKPHEIENTKHFINGFDSNITRTRNKALKLFKLILKSPNIDKKKAKRLISSEAQDASFDRLVARLRKKVYEALLLELNIDHEHGFTPLFKNVFEKRKSLMQASIIHGRGLIFEANDLYSKIIKHGTKYELYDEVLEALYAKQSMWGMRHGKKEFEKYLEDIAYFESCRHATIRAKYWFHRFYIEVHGQGLNHDKVGLLTEALSELQEHYKVTGSQNVGFYLYVLMMEYHTVVEDFFASCETGEKLVQLMSKFSYLFNKKKRGIVYLDYASSLHYIYDFGSAIEQAQIGQRFLKKGSFNFQLGKEMEFFGWYYKGDLENAAGIIDYLIGISDPEKTPYHHSVRHYWKACVLFMKGEYRPAYLILNQTYEIDKDKEGWNISRRILSILCHIELSLHDNADAEVEALRKHIGRTRNIRDVRMRDQIILQLLVQLERHSFEFEHVWEMHHEAFDKLASNEKDYRWEIRTPELIIFHKWFEAKAKGIAYEFMIPQNLINAQFDEQDALDQLSLQKVSAGNS